MLPVPGHLGDPLLAVACRDNRVKIRVWNAVTGAMEGRSMSSPPIKATGAPPGGGGTVTALTTMHTDIGHDLLIAGNTNHTIGLWDLATGTLLHRLDFGEEITACHASSERLIVASESGVTLLDLNGHRIGLRHTTHGPLNTQALPIAMADATLRSPRSTAAGSSRHS
jgi:WD40 repeat protein